MIPQAFTTRDMSDAYKWLQTLPPSVREEIKTMEQMVSLYLRAKRLGGSLPTREEVSSYVPPSSDTSLGHTKSGQDFQKTLKNLKHELEQFDFAGAGNGAAANQSAPRTASPQVASGQGSGNETHQAANPHHPIPQTPSFANQGVPENYPPQGLQLQGLQMATNTPANNLVSALRLDPRSRQIVNEIRESLNLSSDTEVIRMSLVLAHRNLKDLLK